MPNKRHETDRPEKYACCQTIGGKTIRPEAKEKYSETSL